MNPEILIIGAGPAGLACAMELSRDRRQAVLLEQDEQIGGLAKTLTLEEGDATFRTDIGPHRFFSKNPYLYEFIEDLLHEEWRKVPRLTRQFIDGKFYDYPVNAMQVFRNIGLFKSIRIGLDYLGALLTYRLLGKKVVNFEDYVVANFGRTLAEFSMINYTEKIWGIEASTIHPDWARQRISGLNLLSVLQKALFLKKQSAAKSLVDEFYYPQFGTGRIYEKIAERLQQIGTEIHTQSYPTCIHHENQRVVSVDAVVRGENRRFDPSMLVESIPINLFLELMQPEPPADILEAARGLRWRSQVYLFLTLDRPSISRDNWIYFPSKKVPFGRVSEMKNFSSEMSPADKTSLFIEFFAFEDDEIWRSSKEQLLDLVMPYFEEMQFFQRSEVRQAYLFRRRNVYPVYDMGYPERLDRIKQYLNGFSNLYYVGRPGRFKYTNQDHSLEMGIVTARSILDAKACNLDEIGADDEYFESGRIYEKRI